MNSGIRYSLAGAAALLCFATASHAATHPVITGNVQIKPLHTLTDEESRAMSLAATEFLDHVERARMALKSNAPTLAGKHIDQAIKLSRIIQSALPSYKVTTDISAKGEKYDDSETAKQRFVKALNGTSIIDVVTPIRNAHRKKPVADMDRSTLTRTSIVLDSVSAGDAVQQAAQDLKQHHVKAALNDLDELQRNSVRLVVEDTPAPLQSAVDNLALAGSEISSKDYKGAVQTLNVASGDLKGYESITDNRSGKTIRALSEQIDHLVNQAKMENDTARLAKLMDKSRDRIDKWWSESAGWVHQHI